jgi:hypothetical protein
MSWFKEGAVELHLVFISTLAVTILRHRNSW